jgi:hypothetical protein
MQLEPWRQPLGSTVNLLETQQAAEAACRPEATRRDESLRTHPSGSGMHTRTRNGTHLLSIAIVATWVVHRSGPTDNLYEAAGNSKL